MKLLVVAARFPEYGYKGDQLRTRQLIELLAPEHELQVITAGPPSGPQALAELQRVGARDGRDRRTARPCAQRNGTAGARRSGAGRMDGTPAAAPSRTPAAAGSDAVIASTVRVVTGRLSAPLIVDHIDALSVSMRERARLERSLPLRAAARVEAILWPDMSDVLPVGRRRRSQSRTQTSRRCRQRPPGRDRALRARVSDRRADGCSLQARHRRDLHRQHELSAEQGSGALARGRDRSRVAEGPAGRKSDDRWAARSRLHLTGIEVVE